MGHSGSEAQQEDPNENGAQSDIADCSVLCFFVCLFVFLITSVKYVIVNLQDMISISPSLTHTY